MDSAVSIFHSILNIQLTVIPFEIGVQSIVKILTKNNFQNFKKIFEKMLTDYSDM